MVVSSEEFVAVKINHLVQVFGIMKINLFLLTTFSWDLLPPQGQKRASPLRKPLTISPQIGKDCSKQGQAHLLQQLATRFLPAFSLLRNFFHISHSASYSSLCCWPF